MAGQMVVRMADRMVRRRSHRLQRWRLRRLQRCLQLRQLALHRQHRLRLRARVVLGRLRLPQRALRRAVRILYGAAPLLLHLGVIARLLNLLA